MCRASFRASRRDAKYCSGKCRQRALAARATSTDLDREIEATRVQYWELVHRQAEASGQSVSQILTAQSQFVDEAGNVYMGGEGMGGMGEGRRLVGKTAPPHGGGWCAWGLEAAPAPCKPPPHDRAAREKEKFVRWRKPRGNGGAP